MTCAPVRASKFGLRRSTGSSSACGEALALASHMKRSQCPQYWQGPSFMPSGFVYACDALPEGIGNGCRPSAVAASWKMLPASSIAIGGNG